MILERSLHPQFVSNTFLIADGQGGPAVFIDAGGPVAPLIKTAERLDLEPSHVLLTHHHYDHVCELGALREHWPAIEVSAQARERELLAAAAGEGEDPTATIGTVEAGETLDFGALASAPLHTPGHTAGMLSFLVHEEGSAGRRSVFTGDTLFRGSVGGVRAPGHSTYADLRDSIMGTLMELPGKRSSTPATPMTARSAREWEENAFIRIWRGLDPEGSEPCTALGDSATLVLLGADYDGGTKAWVRWPDGADDIVPGSRVERAG